MFIASETMRLWVLLLGVFLFSGGVCRLGLACQFVRSLPIASREVKWNEAGDARSFGDIARLARDIGVRAEERGLDEKLVGIPRQCDDFLDVPLIVGEVDRISDFLPRRCAQGVPFEVTERTD